MSINKLDKSFVETQKSITEAMKQQEIAAIKNPILQRCAAKNSEPAKDVHQAYDRMHHRHNRS